LKRARPLLADPLFLGACLLYALNRWVLLPLAPHRPAFFRDHFNDLLLIPAALPPLLALYAALGLRRHWSPPRPLEVLTHLALWSLLCEWIGPYYLHKGTADFRDVMAYASGAFVALLYWSKVRSGGRARDEV
jgi:hypothetical protein